MTDEGDPLTLHDERPAFVETHRLLELVLAEVRGVRADRAGRNERAPSRP